ncbi:GTP-binding protein [Patescibacteria group bacterium AH-259-L05]|nr:GTP-binding protein [Patescibacteria group bacterium AH-259-L05]
MKQEIPIVIIGHQDHGKSTLIGRLLLDTKSIQKSRLKEIKETDKSSGQKFELAHLVDSFKQERERKMTMDTTRALLKGKKQLYQLIDVPGHAELISQMLTGASSAEVALLVVSVKEGIREQTLDHLEIAQLLGIEQLGVVINQMDKVDYKKRAFDVLVNDLKKILENMNYKSKHIHFFPVSAWKGDNVVKKSSRISWYDNLTVMEFLENKFLRPKIHESLSFHFLIQDIYEHENEEILIGRVESGELKQGQEIVFLPENIRTRSLRSQNLVPRKLIIKNKIKAIKTAEGNIDKAVAGQNVGIICEEKSQTKRGTIGSHPNALPNISKMLSGEIFWIRAPSQKQLVCECGTSRVNATLLKPDKIISGKKSLYKLRLEKPIAFEPQSKTILSKIVLKDQGHIIAVGNIQ